MVETFFKRSCTILGLRRGPLAGHIDLLADHLAAHGFSRVPQPTPAPARRAFQPLAGAEGHQCRATQ